MPRVSLCMIVRDEEADLPACLATSAELVDELVVVDTGSADGTRAAAEQFGARVFDFAWRDDFAAARNESLRHATGDWIFWLDADDRIDGANRDRLRALFAGLGDENVGYVMTYLALREMGRDRASAAHHVKLFPNRPDIRWQYRVHEQILPAIERSGGEARLTDVVIHHLGYQDPTAVRRKLERNMRLLRLEESDHPGDPYTVFNLGRTVLRLDDPASALPFLERAWSGLPPGSPLARTAAALRVESLGRLGRHAEALTVCRDARSHFPADPELRLGEALTLANLGDLAGAEAALVELLRIDPGNTAAQTYLARIRPSQPFFQFTV